MTTQSPIYERLEQSWQQQDSLLCVGLDPIRQRLPAGVPKGPAGLLAFCRAIVDATASYACCFKPQAAHFAAEGAEAELAELIAYVHARHPGLPVVLDAKRGDVGSTATLYAREAFERYGADIVTLNPYLGEESVRPFLGWPGRGVAIVCRTSNPDSGWMQRHPERDPLYLRVAEAAVAWNVHADIMLVAGATYPGELAAIRERVGDMPILVPGVGAQGGDLEAVLRAGLDSRGRGLLISASRSVLYASDGPDFAEAAAVEARSLRDAMRALTASLGRASAIV